MLQYEGAAQFLTRALQLNRSIEGEWNEQVAKTNYLLAQVYWNQGKWDIAEPYVLKSLEIREKVLGIDHLKVGRCLTGLGEMWIERNPNKAKPILERAMDILILRTGKDHFLVSRVMHDLATIHDTFGEHDRAVQLHLEAITIREKTLGPMHPQLGTSYEILGITYKLQGELRKAEAAFKRGMLVHETVHGEIYTSVSSCLEWLVMVYNDLNLPFEADKCETRRLKIQFELDKLGIVVGERIVD